MLRGLRAKLGVVIISLMAVWVVTFIYLSRSHPSWTLPVISLLAVLSLIVMMYSFSRFMLQPLHRMKAIMSSMIESNADLTQRLDIRTSDEFGEVATYINMFMERLQDLVVNAGENSKLLLKLTEEIRKKTDTFASGAREQEAATNGNFQALERMDRSVQDIAGSAESLNITSADSSATVTEMAAQVDVVAESTANLSSHVEEASSSISEMNMSIKEVAENVKALSELASKTADGIGHIYVTIREVEGKAKMSASLSQEVSHDADTLGNEAIAKTMEAMGKIKETVEQASVVIEGLSLRSAEVGKIIKVIDEITNQTSLLALNAAILAAQAGEHGKGFSVVANEIKDLAERTSSSTGEIAKLIKSVQEESQAAVKSMRSGKERVIEGTKTASGAAEALAKIIESSNRSMKTAIEIEQATTRQVDAVQQVADAITNVHERVQQIEKATQEQTRGSELIASASDKINDISRGVRRAMDEQAKGIRDFAKGLEDTRDLAGTIANATKNQKDDSGGIVGSMEKFLEIAQNNSEMSKDMEQSVAKLLKQAVYLRDEMGKFKV
ncbi:MAG: methyl-accepting chemotaxis protein [Nitrospirota bacterium]